MCLRRLLTCSIHKKKNGNEKNCSCFKFLSAIFRKIKCSFIHVFLCSMDKVKNIMYIK